MIAPATWFCIEGASDRDAEGLEQLLALDPLLAEPPVVEAGRGVDKVWVREKSLNDYASFERCQRIVE
jgi:hypothetical protein